MPLKYKIGFKEEGKKCSRIRYETMKNNKICPVFN